MSTKPTKPRRTRIPQVAYFSRWNGNGTIRFVLPITSKIQIEERLVSTVLAAVNRALYDFNRGAGK